MKFPTILSFTVCFSALLFCACTNKQLYNTVQESNESRCRAKVGAERDQCFTELNKKDYQEYEQDRKAIVEDNLD